MNGSGIAGGEGRVPGTPGQVELGSALACRGMRRRARWTAVATSLILAGCVTTESDRPGTAPTARDLEQRLQRRVEPTMPAGAPDILSEFLSWRGVSGGLRSLQHNGIDIHGNWGEPVIAAAPGMAQISVSNWGITAVVTHDAPLVVPAQDGEPAPVRLRVRTFYGHLSETAIPRTGRHRVARGEIIGWIGRTGIMSGDTAHVHFMAGPVRRQDQPLSLIDVINPHLLWADGEGRVTCFDPKRRYPRDRLTLTYPVRCAAPGR